MLESYHQEVIRKRRSARIFWFLVFCFSTFLYFFFQGFYPDIRVGVRQILGTSGSTLSGSSNDIIKSFGIINISVKTPSDATIVISSGSFGNNEKRMVGYGLYDANITRPWYVTDTFSFTIDRDIPYYISAVSLIPIPRYALYNTGIANISRISDTIYVASTASGMLILDEVFSWSRVSSGNYTPIGEGYFLSGTSIYRYNSEENSWERKIWSGSVNYIRECDDSLAVKSNVLSCKSRETILTQWWKTLTGITDIRWGYIRRWEKILIGESMDPINLTWSTETQSPFFIEHDGIWYATSSGNLMALSYLKNKKSVNTITTGLDVIEHAEYNGNLLISLGKKWDKKMISLMNLEAGKTRLIDIGWTDFEEVRIMDVDGNIFIKTRNAVSFIYNDSHKVEWIVDGRIIAFSRYGAIYESKWEIWSALWNEIPN